MLVADVNIAVRYMLTWEDATLSGVITTDPLGGRTRFGISERFHPNLTAIGFFDKIAKSKAIEIAEAVYNKDYCEPLQINIIANQAIANKLVSLGVNCGVGTVSRWLQNAVGVTVDGMIGVITLDALDHADPQKVLDSLREQAVEYYQDIAQDHPEMGRFLGGWLRRANA